MTTSTELFSILRQMRALRFEAQSEAATGWDGTGIGTVVVSEPDVGVVVFEESGTWRPAASHHPEAQFQNTFRWSAVGPSLRLEHLRFGSNHPVLLFDMAPGGDGRWREVSPHECREDCYAASLSVEEGRVLVAWTISGPRKRESIRYAYW